MNRNNFYPEDPRYAPWQGGVDSESERIRRQINPQEIQFSHWNQQNDITGSQYYHKSQFQEETVLYPFLGKVRNLGVQDRLQAGRSLWKTIYHYINLNKQREQKSNWCKVLFYIKISQILKKLDFWILNN